MEEPLRLKVGGQVRTFSRPFVLIGRHQGADIVVSRRDMLRLQVYLQVVGGRLLAVDLSGGAGVRWEDGRRTAAGWLDPGHDLRVGPVKVRPVGGVGGEGRGDVPAPLDATLRTPAAVIEVGPPASGAATGPAAYPVGRVLTLVGRSRRCGIHLPDASVSDFHAALLQTASGLWLIDLLGRGGVAVNGVHVPTARLGDGDALEIGGYAVRVRVDAPAASSAGLPATVAPANRPQQAGPPAEQTPAHAEGMSVPPDVLFAAFMHMTHQFGQSQQHMLEQFLETASGRFRDATATLRGEQAALRDEVRQLRQLVEMLVRDRLDSAAREQGPGADAAGVRGAQQVGEFYSWLTARTDAVRGEQQRGWQSIFGRFLGQAHDTSRDL